MKKSFQEWEEEEIRISFGIKRVRKHEALLSWINADAHITDFEKNIILYLQDLLIDKADFWNEDELKFHFIAPFVRFVNLNTDKYSTFTQRHISQKLKDVNNQEIELYGKPEYFVAMGLQKPRQPFFFVKEYKPEKRGSNDPLGQLLAAMIAAQRKNEIAFPLKGCYVIGRNWFFVILLPDGIYSVSDAFVATQEDIFQIFKILKNTKLAIEDLIQKYNFK